MARSAKFHGVAYRSPSVFPISSVSLPRVLLARRPGPKRARELAKALYRAYFVDDVDISSADNTSPYARSSAEGRRSPRRHRDQAIKDRTGLKWTRRSPAARSARLYRRRRRALLGLGQAGQIDKWLATALVGAYAEYLLYGFAQSGNCYKAALYLELAGPTADPVRRLFQRGDPDGGVSEDQRDGEAPVLEHGDLRLPSPR